MPSGLKQAKVSKELILDPTARIKKLSDHGSSVEIDVAIPIRRYYRSGSEMERQARVYYSEGQFDRAFILYNKFATLFIEKIPKHPEYSKAAPTDKARIKKLLKQVFPRAMELKEKLKTQFEKERNELLQNIAEEERVRHEEEAARRESEEEQRRREEELKEARERQIREAEQAAIIAAAAATTALVDTERDIAPSYDANQSSVTYTEDSLAVENRDSFIEDIVPHEDTGPEPSEEQPSESLHLTATDPTLAHVLPDPIQAQAYTSSEAHVPMSVIEGLTLNERGPPQSVTPSAPPPAYDQVYMDGHQMMVPPSPVQSPMGGPHMGPPVSPAHSPMGVVSPGQSVALNPVLLRQNSYDLMFQAPYQSSPILPQQQPPPPGHTYSYFHGAPPTSHDYVHQGVVPSMNQYASPSGQTPAYSTAYSVEVTGESVRPGVPTVDRSTKPASLKALSTSSSWEGGYRTVVIPGDVATQFEQVASSNTRKNIETCGILAGKLAQNVFRVTHIIVPKQKGQSDSCETTHEEELFDAQDKYDLITLGWIHTAFMSSVDLHCHCSYQIMLDEAIAIVCAPKYSEVGMYMLTEPHGLNYITHCEQEGFHVHPKNPPLYGDCKHVQQDNSAFIQIVDLR